MKQSIESFAKQNSFETKMNRGGLDSYSNYMGEDLGELVVVPRCGRSRDTEPCDESNFHVALEMLGGESKTVQVHRMDHWACGWFEIITVDPRDKKRLEIAFEIAALLEDYPLLDDSDYYERQQAQFEEFAENHKHDTAEAIAEHFGLEVDNELVNLAFALQVECQHYSGNNACIHLYTGREPSERDLERIAELLGQLKYSNWSDSELFQFLNSILNGHKE